MMLVGDAPRLSAAPPTWHDLAASVIGVWGAPADLVAWVALAIGVTLGMMAFTSRAAVLVGVVQSMSRRRYLGLTGLLAALLSLGYVAYYLRGGPRIIDATSYFLEGRSLARGFFSFPIDEPTASFRGRFLLFQEPDRLGGIFPPGFPLLLAIGFRLGAPLLVGPLLGAGLVVTTYQLTKELTRGATFTRGECETAARLAAALSVICVVLRYHTADTMAHGASALGITLALIAALRARQRGTEQLGDAAHVGATLLSVGMPLLSGLAIGFVSATRLASALPAAVGVMLIVTHGDAPRRTKLARVAFVVMGILPGLALLMTSQHAVTGHAWQSTQRAYYAMSDGPRGCFRYGFGKGVGCLFEHGEFVRARLSGGYGLLQAAGTTVRRLHLHSADIFNFEPLALWFLVASVRYARKSFDYRIVLGVALGQVVAYAPFYFDGSYPGGGARFLADVLPLEHALFAVALSFGVTAAQWPRRALSVAALSFFGFAVHTVNSHRSLAERDGGRPMFEPDVVARAGVTDGLLYLDTDHGFNLAYDPSVTPSHGIAAVRLRNDDRDRLLYDELGHPPAHVYRFDPGAPPRVEPFVPPLPLGGTWRFEAESEWPPLAQTGGWVQPLWAEESDASQGRVLELTPDDDERGASATINLPMPPGGPFVFTPYVLLRGNGARGMLRVVDAGNSKDDPPRERFLWQWNDPAGDAEAEGRGHVVALAARSFDIDSGSPRTRMRLILESARGAIALDRVTVKAGHR